LSVSKVLDPSKSPLKRETLIPVSPFLRGVRGDQQVPKITANYFSNNLLNSDCNISEKIRQEIEHNLLLPIRKLETENNKEIS
jgi:hypothetical protein